MAIIGSRTPPVGALVEIVARGHDLVGMRGIIEEPGQVRWLPTTRGVPGRDPYTQQFLPSWLTSNTVKVIEGVWGTWNAPATDHLQPVATPVGVECRYCQEEIKADDVGGAITIGMGAHHRECALRAVMGGIGHHVDHAKYCHGELGTDAGLTLRESALLVWDVYHGRTVTEDDLRT